MTEPFPLGRHQFDGLRDLFLGALKAGEAIRVENYARSICMIARDAGIDADVDAVVRAGRDFLETVREAHKTLRPQIAEAAVTRYERELPEADAVYSLVNADVRNRGWERLQRDLLSYGDALPWPKMGGLFRLRPSETTIWAGPNGSMKSAALNFTLAHLAWHGVKTFVASLELTVEDQLARIAKQMLLNTHPVRSRYDALMDRLGENLMVYDYIGQVRPERMLALARYAAADLGCRHILIDNLTMVVPPARDADEKAAKVVAGLYQIGRDTGAHIHLIAHVRKPSDPTARLSRYDIRGTGAAPDMVDNVLIVQRNESKQIDRDEGKSVDPQEPDIRLTVDKQRHGAWRGRVAFWVTEHTMRLTESHDAIPQAYC